MVKDYADDIDTLLVFVSGCHRLPYQNSANGCSKAGLFSAVLTAFLVETYPMLQPDNAQISNQLLEGIYMHISASSTDSGQHTPPSANPSFTPSSAARWVNILFFLSLVFSLSAATFGILVKQWLREYMKWNSTLGSPRENVLIRQIRFEAWEAWNIAATISSIPALLELAMILFLAGTVILLWTLDTVVAAVITVTVALFMAAVSAFTVLPVFYSRCPYKSPTAWAFVSLVDLVYRTTSYTLRSAVEYAVNIRYSIRYWPPAAANVIWKPRIRNWRQRERGGEGTAKVAWNWWWRRVPERTMRTIERALFAELVVTTDDGVHLGPYKNVTPIHADASKHVIKDLSEATMLFRALAWVNKASQNPRVQTHIIQSMETLHTELPDGDIGLGIKNVFDWSLLCSLQTGTLDQPQLAVTQIGNMTPGIDVVQNQVRSVLAIHDTKNLRDNKIIMRARQRVQYGGAYLRAPSEYSSLFAYLVAVDLNAAVASFHQTVLDPRATEVSPIAGRMMLELLCVLGSICINRYIPTSKVHLAGFRELVCNKDIRSALDMAYPGLRSSALMIACRLWRVESTAGEMTSTSHA